MNSINIIQWNCQGIANKKDELLQIIEEKLPKVIALQETMCGPRMTPRVPHYNVFSKPGTYSGRYHGGVSLLTHESVPIYSEIQLNTPLQAVAIQIHLQIKITFCSIYNSRSHIINNELLLNLAEQLPTPFMILGDLNAYSTEWGCQTVDARGRQIERFLATSGLTMLNTGCPTRISHTTATAIDLSIVSPVLHQYFNWSVMPSSYDSDHHPILISQECLTSPHCTTKFNVKNADWIKYRQSAAWNNISEDLDHSIDEAIKTFYERLDKACKDSMPQIKKSQFFPKPWWSESLKRSRDLRENMYRRYRRNKTEINLIRWKRARAEHRQNIKKHKQETWRKYISEINVNTPPSKVWEKIRRINI